MYLELRLEAALNTGPHWGALSSATWLAPDNSGLQFVATSRTTYSITPFSRQVAGACPVRT